MKQLTCEMCGSTDLLKQDGVFVCQTCGTKYSVEEAKKMMIEGTVEVSGTVKVDKSGELDNLLVLAERALKEGNYESAESYYDNILRMDPDNWRANFYKSYCSTMQSKIANVVSNFYTTVRRKGCESMKKLLLILSALSVSAIILTGCACKHAKWNDADCTTPKTCAKCGETEGVPLGHTWKDASCKYPKTCEVCGETEGDLGEHKWKDATCEVPKTCTVCGETEGTKIEHEWIEASCKSPKTCKWCNITEGEKADSHKWVEATCKEPKTCSVCGKTEGEATEHKWEEATCKEPKTCSVCGKTEGSSLQHTWVDATYDAPKTCTLCGETIGDPLEKPPVFITFKNSFPSEYSYYDWDNDIVDTIKLTNVTYTVEESWSGDYEVTLFFTGEKTYDCKGSGQGRSGKISYKIYDSDGYVIDNDTYYTPSLRTGEKFRDDEESLWTIDFAPGSYTIEFGNTN